MFRCCCRDLGLIVCRLNFFLISNNRNCLGFEKRRYRLAGLCCDSCHRNFAKNCQCNYKLRIGFVGSFSFNIFTCKIYQRNNLLASNCCLCQIFKWLFGIHFAGYPKVGINCLRNIYNCFALWKIASLHRKYLKW